MFGGVSRATMQEVHFRGRCRYTGTNERTAISGPVPREAQSPLSPVLLGITEQGRKRTGPAQ